MTEGVRGFIEDFGRKFFLSLACAVLATIVTLCGLFLVARHPGSGVHLAEIVGSFTIALSVAIGAFNTASAVGDVANKGLPYTKMVTTKTETATATSSTAARPSGSVAEVTEDKDT